MYRCTSRAMLYLCLQPINAWWGIWKTDCSPISVHVRVTTMVNGIVWLVWWVDWIVPGMQILSHIDVAVACARREDTQQKEDHHDHLYNENNIYPSVYEYHVISYGALSMTLHWVICIINIMHGVTTTGILTGSNNAHDPNKEELLSTKMREGYMLSYQYLLTSEYCSSCWIPLILSTTLVPQRIGMNGSINSKWNISMNCMLMQWHNLVLMFTCSWWLCHWIYTRTGTPCIQRSNDNSHPIRGQMTHKINSIQGTWQRLSKQIKNNCYIL